MAKHTLTWLEGRATPVVTPKGQTRRNTAGGKVVASRSATEAEEAQIAKGEWIRARPPGNPGKESSVRSGPSGRRKEKNRPTSDAGLWENIRRKKRRKENGSGERKAQPGEKGRPSEEALERSKTKGGK